MQRLDDKALARAICFGTRPCAPITSSDVAVKLRGAVNARIADPKGIATITDIDAPVISIDDAQVSEPESGTANLSFTVTLNKPAETPVTVKYTAPAGVGDGAASIFDIRPILVGTINFAPGETSKNIDVVVRSDNRDEADETVDVRLLTSNLGLIGDALGVGTIVDSGETPALSISDVEVTEGGRGVRMAHFNVTLSQPSGREVSVDIETVDDTATAGSDYAALLLTRLNFAPGQTTKRVTIPVFNDQDVEDVERFLVNLTNPVNTTRSLARGISLTKEE